MSSKCVDDRDYDCCKDDNARFGFDDVSEHTSSNPGKNDFCCDFCGIYTASKPRCNKCEEW